MAKTPPIPVICGPTGSGKTGVAVELARDFPLEIISADSRQIIRRLDIGTAKPTAAERAAVSFHLVDIIDPGEPYSAFRFLEDAERAISEILNLRHIPMLVGGTGFYLSALTDGVVKIEEIDRGIRERLESEMDRDGPEALHARLAEIDPGEAARIHPHNRPRLIRALEIFEQTGRSKTELTSTGAYKKSNRKFELYCLQPEREALYDRINRRVDEMLAEGLVEEIERLVEEGWREPVRAAKVIGYQEILDFLEGRCSLAEAADMIRQNSRRYAKRQMTWFRHQTDCRYFEAAQGLRQELTTRLAGDWAVLKT